MLWLRDAAQIQRRGLEGGIRSEERNVFPAAEEAQGIGLFLEAPLAHCCNIRRDGWVVILRRPRRAGHRVSQAETQRFREEFYLGFKRPFGSDLQGKA
jgi:hypothetical protein